MINCIEITQPMGTYYISKLTIGEIEEIFIVNRRKGDGGIQRKLDVTRKKGITKYCEDPDAIFPTPIIFSIKSDDVEDFTIEKGMCSFTLKDGIKASVVDGQHRIYGIMDSDLSKTYEMPVVFMFDITEEEEAYIFSTINYNQKTVDKSLIYDLFGVYQTRSPKKTCHEIAKALNDAEFSPFYKRLKVLGRKESAEESLSQGTFAYHLLPHICPPRKADEIAIEIKKNQSPTPYPECIFNSYFINGEDSTIYKILVNYFSAVANVFSEEWENPSSILSKTTGYGGLMKALKYIYPICKKKKNASVKFFEEIFIQLKEELDVNGIKLTSQYFGSGDREQRRLARFVINCAESVWA